MIRRISFRLGTAGGLYLGICLGVVITSVVMVGLELVLLPAALSMIAVSVAFIVAGIFVAFIITLMQEKRETSTERFCTCRFRKTLYTFCRECARSDTETEPEPEKTS